MVGAAVLEEPLELDLAEELLLLLLLAELELAMLGLDDEVVLEDVPVLGGAMISYCVDLVTGSGGAPGFGKSSISPRSP